MRIAITGSTGFVGSHLCPMLEAKGLEVTRIGRMTIPEMVKALKASQSQIVVHLATLFVSDHKGTDIQPLVNANLLYGTQLLEAMAQVGVTRLINVGTSWQCPRPFNLYAATKQAFESIVGYYIEAHGLNVVTLMLGDTYGPDDKRRKLLTVLREANGDRMPFLPANHKIDLTHVDDVCRAIIAATDLRSGRWSVSSGPTELGTVVSEFERASGKKLNIGWGERKYRSREAKEPRIGEVLPGWVPRVTLREGMEGLFK